MRRNVSGTRVYGNNDKRRIRSHLLGLMDGIKSAPVSPNTGVLDLTWDEDEARSVKRKKDTPGPKIIDDAEERQVGKEAIATKIRMAIKSIEQEVRVIMEVAKERNTKREVKEASVKLNSLVSTLMTTEAQEILQNMGGCNHILGHADHEIKIRQLEEENAELIREKTRLQKELSSRGGKSGETHTMREELFGGLVTYEDFVKLERLKWAGGIFKTAFRANGSLSEAGRDADALILIENGDGAQVNLEQRRHMEERHPELKELEGRVSSVSLTSRFVDATGANRNSERTLWRVEAEEVGPELFEALIKIRTAMEGSGRGKLATYAPGTDRGGGRYRKMLEYVFRDRGIKCLLFSKKVPGGGRKAIRKTGALVLHRDGHSYADLLREVKQEVKAGTGAAKAIKTIREGRDGGMVIVLNEDRSSPLVEELRKGIGKLESIKVTESSASKDTQLIIRDIDGLATQEEVVEAISCEAGLTITEIKAGTLRKGYGGNQTITVRLPTKEAKHLEERGTIRIGLCICQVRSRVDVLQCYRCWKYGHTGRDCHGEDASKACRKCGQVGHLLRNCNNEETCLTCKVPGHRAGSGRCPEFKKALARERLKRRKKTAY